MTPAIGRNLLNCLLYCAALALVVALLWIDSGEGNAQAIVGIAIFKDDEASQYIDLGSVKAAKIVFDTKAVGWSAKPDKDGMYWTSAVAAFTLMQDKPTFFSAHLTSATRLPTYRVNVTPDFSSQNDCRVDIFVPQGAKSVGSNAVVEVDALGQ